MPGEYTRQLSRRVQEFELFKDDKDVFKDVEYARRRAERRRELKKLESDKRLKCWKKVYIPALLFIFVSTVSLLCSSISSLGQNSFFFAYKDIFHIVGPIVLLIGIIFLMVAAACSYREEERLRIELGLPSQFPQPRSLSSSSAKSDGQTGTTSEMKKLLAKEKKKKKGMFWRKASTGSLEHEISNFLESSASSAHTETTWLQHSASRPITLQVAEAHIFEEYEEDEGHFQPVVDSHTTMCSRHHLVKIHPKAAKAMSESMECFVSENSSGYSTVTGSDPENQGGELRAVVVEAPVGHDLSFVEREEQFEYADQR